MHKAVYNSETIWDKVHIKMFMISIDFEILIMNISGDYVKSILPYNFVKEWSRNSWIRPANLMEIVLY